MEPFPWINYCKMIKLNQIAFRMRIGTSKSCNQFFSSFVGSNKYKNLINKVKTLTEQNLENSNFCVSTEESNFMKKIHSLSISAASVKQKNKELKQQIQAVETENNQYKEIIEQFRAEISKKAEQNSELSDQLKIALGKLNF